MENMKLHQQLKLVLSILSILVSWYYWISLKNILLEVWPNLKQTNFDLKNPKFTTSLYRQQNKESMSEVFGLDIPQEALDPNSQFYGFIYRNTYGLPASKKLNKENFWERLSKDLPTWQQFMPETAASLEQMKLNNPTEKSLLFTSPENSYVIVENKENYKIDEEFVFQIQARDFRNQSKPHGGDFFRAVLRKLPVPEQGLGDGVPCKVQDHLNGTYTLRASLLTAGRFKLDVLLCSSVEAVASYVKWADGRTNQGFQFKAELESSEIVQCNSDLLLYERFKDKVLCDYSTTRLGEPFFCEMPPSGNCTPIIFMSYKWPKDAYLQKPFDISKQLVNKFWSYKKIRNSGVEIEVLPLKTTEPLWFKLNSDIQRSTGFSKNGHWVSLLHNYMTKPLKDFAPCFSNKVVYMIGDSTIRQFFVAVEKPLKLNVSVENPQKHYHAPRLGRNIINNITIYFRSHGIPIRTKGPPNIAPFISDTVDSIKAGGKHLVLIINIGLHYLEFNPVIFIHRLIGIKKALIRHSENFPDTKIIIKGMNVSNLKYNPLEWLVWRSNILLKEMFKDLKNSVFIDLWDMTTLWSLTESYHPPDNIIHEQANLIFNQICE